MTDDDDKHKKSGELPSKWRRFIREDMFMKKLTDDERKHFEECIALLQGIAENGNVEEACELLEKYPFGQRDSGSKKNG